MSNKTKCILLKIRVGEFMNFDFFKADCFDQPRKHEMKEARNYHLFRVFNFSCFRGHKMNNEAKEKAIQDCP